VTAITWFLSRSCPHTLVGTGPRDNLPRRTTTFIGRDQEVQRVTAALRENPLVTLTGVGGVGKTRLALETAARNHERFRDGVWVCELAPLDEGAAVGHTVATALRLQQRQGLGIEETVIEYLRARELLLVVDNCEHVLEAAARLLDQIARHCPRVSMLATSRKALGVEGERILPVPDTLELLTGLVDKSMLALHTGTGMTRYAMLETLRAYGRERLCEKDIHHRYAERHAVYYTELAERAAAGMHGADEQAWVERMLPDYDDLRAAFERAMADRDGDLALRLVTSLPELVHLRIGYEASGWAERTLGLADPDHPLFPAAVGVAARGAWNRGEFANARSLAALAQGRVPHRGTGRIAYPADVLADVALYEGDATAALAHYDAEVARARRDDDPIRLVWTLFYVAICHAALRNPEHGLPAAEEAVHIAEDTANPTARSMARYALGLVVKKSQPDRALALFEEAADLAASVQNFWWHGIASMEAAATRAVHGDPAIAARDFVGVLDHWDRVGDWSQQWLNLRYITRLLVRLGADDDAVALHHTLVRAGKPSPLSAAKLAVLAERLGADRFYAVSGSISGGSAAVARARASLGRYG
jgi:hypothetical protein